MTELVYGSQKYLALKNEALELCGVVPSEKFDAKRAIRERIDYLKATLRETGMNGYVLGISGGVDSSTVGRLCQLACEELRAEGYSAQFIGMRLPAGVQLDEADAQKALAFINADKTLTVNVGDAATNLITQGVSEYESVEPEGAKLSAARVDFIKGNIKARLRMIAQYEVAAMYNALVIGTDHNSENVTGFFTKWGDGACDLIVLNGVNKTQVRMMARELGAPESVWAKFPTADLEELNPQKHDQDGFGFEYDLLDKFLEGKPIDQETEYKIVRQYMITQHKRLPIVSFIPERELS